MSKCLWCSGPVKTSSKTGKPRKYCSKKCSNELYKQRNKNKLRKTIDGPTPCQACGKLVERFLSTNKPKKYCSRRCSSDPKWQERLKKNAWIEESCISQVDLAEDLGLSRATIYNRARELDIKTHFKCEIVDKGRQRHTAWYEKKDTHLIRDINKEKKVPDGFITRDEASKLLGLTIYQLKGKLKRIEEKLKRKPIEAHYKEIYYEEKKQQAKTVLYNKEDLMKVLEDNKEINKNCNHCDKEFQTMYETKTYCSKTCSKTAQKARQRVRLEETYASTTECYDILDKEYKGLDLACSPKHFLNNNIDKYGFVKKQGKRKYILRTQLNSFIEQFRMDFRRHLESKEVEKIKTKHRQHAKIIRRSSDQNTWEYKERLWFFRSREKIISLQERYGIDSEQFQKLIISINKRSSYLVDYWSTGAIAHFECTTCEESMPFYSFYTSTNTSLLRGLHGTCSSCRKIQTKASIDKVSLEDRKQYWKKNYRARLRRLIATSIKQFVNENAGESRNGFGVPAVWRALKEKCGYDIEDLVKHIESQFTPNMNWENQTRPTSPGEYGWQLDHIIPHSSFKYDSFDHPDFAKCWALENLRPLSSIMNLQKGNKDLYQEHYRTFRYGIMLDKEYTTGVWKFLPFTNLEAKKNIEKKFAPGMSWENHGDTWHIDHIDPLAHLAYLGESDNNFLKAWSLSNLQPLSVFDNTSKSSIFENKKWIHNYQEATL
jgi:hypothetical protein